MALRIAAPLAGLVLVGGLSLSAFAEPLTATSRVDAVTVFPSGAEVVRTSQVRITPETGAVVFSDLPPEAVAGSIRVDGKSAGKLEIGAVDTRRLFVPQHSGVDTESERKRIEKEIEALDDRRKLAEAKVSAADTQRALIANLANLPNRPAPAAGSSAPQENWASVITLIATSLKEVAGQRLDAEAEVRELTRQIEDLKGKLAALAPSREERTEVRVAVKVEQELQASLTVRYQVPNASWSPSYDARLETGTKETPPSLTMMRRATISQRTGEAWDNVAIQLSTTRPSAGTSAPELGTMSVDYPPPPRPVATGVGGRYRAMKKQVMPEVMDMAEQAAPAMAPAACS